MRPATSGSSALLPGEYTVAASLSGFAAAKTRVQVTAGAVPRVDWHSWFLASLSRSR